MSKSDRPLSPKCIRTKSISRSGVLVLGAQESSYQGQAYQHDLDIGANLRSYDTASDIQSAIPDSVPKKSSFEGVSGYLNLDGGWAESAVGVERLMAEVQGLGGTIVAGFPVENLIRRDGKTGGVQSKDGRVEEADHVILAAGPWTATTFAKDLDTLNLETRCLATGYVNCIAY
jgi:sarcosine oxidase / L-pipecolate oxidase